jgi:hypothetical protein
MPPGSRGRLRPFRGQLCGQVCCTWQGSVSGLVARVHVRTPERPAAAVRTIALISRQLASRDRVGDKARTPPPRVAGASTTAFALPRVLELDRRGTVARADLTSAFRALRASQREPGHTRRDGRAGVGSCGCRRRRQVAVFDPFRALRRSQRPGMIDTTNGICARPAQNYGCRTGWQGRCSRA